MQQGSRALAAFVLVAGCSSGQSPELEPDTAAQDNTERPGPTEVSNGQHHSGADVPNQISHAEMGAKWPLTVHEGRLTCIGSGHVGAVVFVAPDGTNYALDATGKSQPAGVPDITEILANDPRRPAAKKDIEPLINRGLRFCSFR